MCVHAYRVDFLVMRTNLLLNVQEQRHSYLQMICKLRNDKTIIYTNEIWVNVHYCKEHTWVDVNSKGGRAKWERSTIDCC